jgi:hypothetical protein
VSLFHQSTDERLAAQFLGGQSGPWESEARTDAEGGGEEVVDGLSGELGSCSLPPSPSSRLEDVAGGAMESRDRRGAGRRRRFRLRPQAGWDPAHRRGFRKARAVPAPRRFRYLPSPPFPPLGAAPVPQDLAASSGSSQPSGLGCTWPIRCSPSSKAISLSSSQPAFSARSRQAGMVPPAPPITSRTESWDSRPARGARRRRARSASSGRSC